MWHLIVSFYLEWGEDGRRAGEGWAEDQVDLRTGAHDNMQREFRAEQSRWRKVEQNKTDRIYI